MNRLSTIQSNQNKFLANIASRLNRERRSGVKPPQWNSEPFHHLYQGKTQEELISHFIASLQLLNTEVDRIHREELAETLGRVLNKFSVQSALFWDDDWLLELGITDVFDSLGILHKNAGHLVNEQELRSFAAHVDIGITSATMGLAETGTLVLFNGEGRGRVVSLLPPVYLCILPESRIVPRLTQAMHLIHNKVAEGLPACINFITGPSRTADIEMDLALGVHGPGKVHVIFLKESSSQN